MPLQTAVMAPGAMIGSEPTAEPWAIFSRELSGAPANYHHAMKAKTISFTVAATIAALGGGCASSTDYSDPNQTARGAAAGAVAGAVIGGVVGNNSDRVSTEKGAAIGAVAGGLAGAAIGHRADQREAARTTQDVGYTVQSIPPAPVSQPYETPPPQPSSNSVWVAGHYDYTGSGYQWVPGRWEIPPAGARTWMQGSWQPAANGGYVYVRGHWQ
jgi:hypothetical protein